MDGMTARAVVISTTAASSCSPKNNSPGSSQNGAGGRDSNSATGTTTLISDHWLELDDSLAVPAQTLDEIMAEGEDLFEDEETAAMSGIGGEMMSLLAGEELLLGERAGSTTTTTRHQRQQAQASQGLDYRLENPLVLRREEAICHQLGVAMRDRPNGGMPSAMAVCRSMLAVGTTRGLVLLFNRRKGTLIHFFRAKHSEKGRYGEGKRGIEQQAPFGSVSCMDFSPDEQRLAVGYSRGAILIHSCRISPPSRHSKKNPDDSDPYSSPKWNRLFTEAIQPGRGVLHLRYMTPQHSLVVVDAGGSVYELNDRQRHSEARCLFTGCRGEVVNVVCVPEEQMVVLVSLKQLLLLSTSHGGLVAQLRLPANQPPNSPPLVDYNCRRVRVTKRVEERECRLAVARGCEVWIYQLQMQTPSKVSAADEAPFRLHCPLVRVLHVEEPIIQLKWVDNYHLLVMNASEVLQLVALYGDGASAAKSSREKMPQAGVGRVVAELETGAAGQQGAIGIVYNSSDYKGLSTGGNVSAAMACLAEQVCYQSMARLRQPLSTADEGEGANGTATTAGNGDYGGGDGDGGSLIYVLGQQAIFRVTLMDQVEQLSSFVERGDLSSALQYATDIYSGGGGLVRDHTRTGDLHERISPQLPQLIHRLIAHTVDGLPGGSVNELVAHYRHNIAVLLRVCVATSHFHLLYHELYRRVERDQLAKHLFLDALEEYVVPELRLDRPPPHLVADYLAQLLDRGELAVWEESITKLPVGEECCLDLHHVVTTCRQHQLYDGLIHVMCEALRDYRSPLEEMFAAVRRCVEEARKREGGVVGEEQGTTLLLFNDCEVALGNKLLLYLSCCLAGRRYPCGGPLPDHHAEIVPLETYKYLIQLRQQQEQHQRPSVTFSDEFNASIRTASKKTSDEEEGAAAVYPNLRLLLHFDAAQFLNVICTCVDAPIFAGAGSGGRLKRLVDILVGGVVELERAGEVRSHLAAALLPFLVSLLQREAIVRDTHMLHQLLLNHVLSASPPLTKAVERSVGELMELLGSSGEDEERMLEMAIQQPHIGILAHILGKRGDYIRLIDIVLQIAEDHQHRYSSSQHHYPSSPTSPPEGLELFSMLPRVLRVANVDVNLRRHLLSPSSTIIHRLNALDSAATAALLMDGENQLGTEYLRRTPAAKIPTDLLSNCFAITEEVSTTASLTGDERADEALFSALFQARIRQEKINKTNSNTKNNKEPNSTTTTSSLLDKELVALLRRWEPLGSLSDHCLNLAVAEGLAECEVHLLVARGFPQRAFERLLEQLVQSIGLPHHLRTLWEWVMELAEAHPQQAVEGEWLLRTFEALPPLSQTPRNSLKVDGAERVELLTTAVERGVGVVENGLNVMAEQLMEEESEIAIEGQLDRIIRRLLHSCKPEIHLYEALLACVHLELAQVAQKRLQASRILFATSCSPQWEHPSQGSSPNCIACAGPITKSFRLFGCGHLVHLDGCCCVGGNGAEEPDGKNGGVGVVGLGLPLASEQIPLRECPCRAPSSNEASVGGLLSHRPRERYPSCSLFQQANGEEIAMVEQWGSVRRGVATSFGGGSMFDEEAIELNLSG